MSEPECSRFPKKCYDSAVDVLRVPYGSVVSDITFVSKTRETGRSNTSSGLFPAEMDTVGISWVTMRVEYKECSMTRRSKAESGSPFKNWLINGFFDGVTVTMRASHAIYDTTRADVWYDFKIQPAKIAGLHAPYWIVGVCENNRNTKIGMLEDVGIVAELAHLILEYSFPTAARISMRSIRK